VTNHRAPRRLVALALGTVSAVALTACGAGSLGSSEEDEGGEGGGVTLSWLMDSAETTTTRAEGVVAAFEEANPDISVEIETRPGGSEGDNIVKTRLSTGDMTDIFQYNTGSLFQALNPAENLVPVTDEEWVGGVDETFKTTVTADGDVYGAPFGEAMGGGILYNKKVYEDLGLQVPKTWDDFMANNEQIKAAGIAPIIQTYGDTWTSQLFVLGDFHNVAAEDPDWAEKYTANEVKYVDEPAVKGFQHQQEAFEAGYFNEDFGAAKFPDGLQKLAAGEGVHYPILTFVLAEIAANFPDQIQDIGFFGLPGDDAAKNGLTVWTAGGVYIPTTTEGDKLEAAKSFLAFLASSEGCDAQAEASPPMGPYQVTECELPTDVPPAVTDLQAYFDQEGATTPALEFLSPVKGPALEQITVEVGSGIRSAEDGAALYDEDVKKQAQQLGLPGWD
jgi:raffinose/stachyose/melibiose transport system substrate-binding protein